MQSYDIGCSYSGGPDPGRVLTGAGLSFVTHSQSEWKKSKCGFFFLVGQWERQDKWLLIKYQCKAHKFVFYFNKLNDTI